MRDHVDGSIKLGVSPANREDWTALYRQITNNETSPLIDASDVKSYDDSQCSKLSFYADLAIRLWYALHDQSWTIGDDNIRYISSQQDRRSLRVIYNLLVLSLHGNPSGSFLTTIRNSLGMLIAFTLTKIHYDLANSLYQSPSHSRSTIITPVFGDDNMKNSIHKGFDLQVTTELFKKHLGLTLTDYAKTDRKLLYHPIEEVTFLKTGFRIEDSVVYAPLQKEVIFEMTNWVTSTMDPIPALLLNMSVALTYAMHHGKQFHSNLRRQFINALDELGISFNKHPQFKAACEFEVMRSKYIYGTSVQMRYVGQSAYHGQSAETTTAQATPTEQVQLTTFLDNIMPDISSRPVHPPHLASANPYPPIDSTKALQRVYSIPVTWASTDATDAILYTADLPNVLIGSYDKQTAAVSFSQYLAAGVKVSLRINGTVLHGGTVLVSWMPHWNNSTGTDPVENGYTVSQINHHLLSAQNNLPCEFIIPYVGPQNFINLSHTYTGGKLATLWITVNNPLILANSASIPSVTIQLSLSFAEPKLAGPTTYSVPRDTSIRRDPSGYRGQSAVSVDKEQQEASKDGMITSAISKVNALVPFATLIPGQIGTAAKTAAPVLTLLESFSRMLKLEHPTSMLNAPLFIPETNSNITTAVGPWTGTKLAIDPANKVSTDPALFNQTVDEMSFDYIKGCPSLIHRIALTSDATPGDLLFKLPVTPTMCYWHQVTTGAHPNVTLTAHYHMPPSAVLANSFAYWRGSMKFTIFIRTPSVISGRLRFFWMPAADHIPSDLSDGGGDFIGSVVDFAGDTDYSFSIPFHSESMYKRSVLYHTVYPATANTGYYAGNLEEVNGMLMCFVQNRFTSPFDVTLSKVYINVYASCGEDMVFYRPREWPNDLAPQTPGLNKPKEVHGQSASIAQTDPRAIFAKPFPPLIPAGVSMVNNIVHGETITHLRTLLLRFSRYTSAISPGINLDARETDTTNPGLFTTFIHMYQFMRGGVRYVIKVAPRTGGNALTGTFSVTLRDLVPPAEDSLGTDPYPATVALGSSALYMADMYYKKVWEFEVPYMNKTTFLPTHTGMWSEDEYGWTVPFFTVKKDGTADNIGLYDIFISCADDFSLGWLKQPFHYEYVLPPAAKRSIDNNNNNHSGSLIRKILG